jgi:hypothetical protein
MELPDPSDPRAQVTVGLVRLQEPWAGVTCVMEPPWRFAFSVTPTAPSGPRLSTASVKVTGVPTRIAAGVALPDKRRSALGVGVAVAVKVLVGVLVGVLLGVLVGVTVGVAVRVGVLVTVAVDVTVEVGVGVTGFVLV